MESLELACFEIISNAGTARSMFIDSIKEAKKGNFSKAHQLVQEGKEYYIKGHHTHAELVAQEADEKPVSITLLLVHAEDQLMSAENFKILTAELIEMCRKNDKLEKELSKLIHDFSSANH